MGFVGEKQNDGDELNGNPEIEIMYCLKQSESV
jgi:hypothetical protein